MNYRASNYCCNAELHDLVEYNAILITVYTVWRITSSKSVGLYWNHFGRWQINE